MRNHLGMQENLAIERDFAVAAASEARKVSQELAKQREYALIAVSEAGEKNQKLQEFLERESSKIMHTVAIIQQEKDTAAHAASEATTSALKAGEVLTEVLCSLKPEMAKARTRNLQLQVHMAPFDLSLMLLCGNLQQDYDFDISTPLCPCRRRALRGRESNLRKRERQQYNIARKPRTDSGRRWSLP
jgi:hypothetical protein